MHCVELERGLDFEEDRADFAVLPELAVSEAFCEPLGAGVVREALICLPRRKLIIFLPEVKALRSCAISVIFEEVEDFLMKPGTCLEIQPLVTVSKLEKMAPPTER